MEIDEIQLSGPADKTDFLKQMRLVESPYTRINTGADLEKLKDNQAVMYWLWRTDIDEEKEDDKNRIDMMTVMVI